MKSDKRLAHLTPTVHNSSKLPVNDKTYLGIDQSLTCTSIALLHKGELRIHRIKSSCVGVQRLVEIREKIEEILGDRPIDGAAIEGYAMSAQGRVFGLGELGGMIRILFYERKYNTIEVPPTVLKKYMSGIGNAKKDVMIKELYKKYEVDVNDDNDSDAAALAIACAEYFEVEYHAIPIYRIPIQATSAQIIGEHPNPMDVDKYCESLGDERVGDFEKKKRGNKPKTVYRKHQLK